MARKKRADGRSLSREVMEHQRFRAVELRKKGWSVQDVADSFGVHRGSVSRWLTKHNRSGVDALRRRKASGAKRKLFQSEQLKLLGMMRCPATDFGFETPLWDCTRVRQLVIKQFGKKIDPSNIWRLLRVWNLSPQVPQKQAFQQDQALVNKWLRKEWPLIKLQAKRWQAIIYFQDEAGVSLIPALGRTWAPQGETPTIKVTGTKGGLSVTSAVSPAGRLLFRIEKEKVNGERHVEFLDQIRQHHPNRKIIVIEDRAPIHRAACVRDFVKSHQRRFALYYLPSYSPELS
ncbi:IS630 family transposase [Candidatus Woesearchaeota archaeon]|nr:IS630 family transposase [Candidatus Woesearchaeota archaeon]